MNELVTKRLPFKTLAFCGANNVRSVAIRIGQISLYAVLSFASSALAEQSKNSDDPTPITREQWKARVDAAKSRIQEMRREGQSFIPPQEEKLLSRILEDSTLVFGDIVTTRWGMFQFIGGTQAPHNPEDFRQVAPDRVFQQR
jgi:hypothetical protein